KRECEQCERVEKGMHCHRNQQRSAPLISKRKTATEHEQRCERWQMSMHSSKQKGREDEANGTPGVAPQNAIKEKSKNEFYPNGRDRDGQHDDDNSLLHHWRAAKELDDSLATGTRTEHALG